MVKKHHLIVVPGLSGNSLIFSRIVGSWKKFGFIIHVHDVGWKDGEESFKPKLQRLVKLIDSLSKDDNIISLVGTSAGGSAILNAFCERKQMIHKVVNICGRLRAGKNVSPTLEDATRSSKGFDESVRLCEENIKLLKQEDKEKILTIRPIYDEVVPTSTTTLEGAKNIQIFSVEHSLSIAAAMTIYFRSINKFLQENK